MADVDKIIVTNLSALLAKYGSKSRAIRSAINAMIAADKKRGLATQLVPIDDAASMKKVGGKPVVAVDDERGAKEAIDAAYRRLKPDYILILGAGDVVPHQTLENPVPNVGDDADPDANVPSDLPYACEVPYSTKPRDFRGPTRVVGRLPDIAGGDDPAYLVDLMKRASAYTSRPASDYATYFGVTAKVWQESTALSVRNTFGNADELQSVPPRTYRWPQAKLSRLSHFINCHGGPSDPKFYGQSGRTYPVSHRASFIEGKIEEGTVVAAECCYGAELYSPSASGEHAGICNTYLAGGAYGYFGSSTTAYGPSEGNGEADLICQWFLQQVLLGASTGRAALESRQKFVQSVAILSPTNLKTLIQFNLMGDPSVHPVETSKGALTRTRAYKRAMGDLATKNSRRLRRDRLARNGHVLHQTVPAAKAVRGTPKGRVRRVLADAARESGVRKLRWASYDSSGGAGGLAGSKALGLGKARFEVAVGKAADHEPPSVMRRVVLLAMTRDGEILNLRRLHSR